MNILVRYISGFFLRNFLFALSGLTLLYFFQALMNEIVNPRYGAHHALIYQSLHLPQIAVQMVPPSVLLATVLTLSGFTKTNELVAFFSIGVGLKHLMSIILLLVVMVCCFSLVVQDLVLPPVYRKQVTYLWREIKKRSDFVFDFKQDKIWYRSKNLIYNLRTFDPNSKVIYGMVVHTFDENFGLVQVIEAKLGQFTPSGWKLKDGTVTVFAGEDQVPVTKKFAEKEVALLETPKDFQEIEKQVDGLRLREMWRYIQRMRESGIDTKAYEVNLFSRLSLSFIPFVMCILAIPFSTQTSRREGGAAKNLLVCLGLTGFYWLFYSLSLPLGINGTIPPIVAAFLPSLVFLLFASFLIVSKRS